MSATENREVYKKLKQNPKDDLFFAVVWVYDPAFDTINSIIETVRLDLWVKALNQAKGLEEASHETNSRRDRQDTRLS